MKGFNFNLPTPQREWKANSCPPLVCDLHRGCGELFLSFFPTAVAILQQYFPKERSQGQEDVAQAHRRHKVGNPSGEKALL